MASGIYCIKNSINHKVYIGSAINIKSRWQHHMSELRFDRHHSRHLQHAWNRDGLNSFEFFVIEIVLNKELLIIREQHWLDHYKSYLRKYGYNLRRQAHSNYGIKRSSKLKALWSKQRTGKQRGIKNPFFGKTHSLESRLKIKEARKLQVMKRGHKLSLEHREKLRQRKLANPVRYWLGKSRSEKTKEKIRKTKLKEIV